MLGGNLQDPWRGRLAITDDASQCLWQRARDYDEEHAGVYDEKPKNGSPAEGLGKYTTENGADSLLQLCDTPTKGSAHRGASADPSGIRPYTPLGCSDR